MVWGFSKSKSKSSNNVVQDVRHTLHTDMPESAAPQHPNRPPKNNKERLQWAEAEAQEKQNKLNEVKNGVAKARNQVRTKTQRPAELREELNGAHSEVVTRHEQTTRLQAAIDKAKADRLALLEELQVSDKAGEVDRQESAVLREKIRRLSEKRAAFQMAQKETKAKRSENAVADQSTEANKLVDKLSEALRSKLTQSNSKAAEVNAEKETWRQERVKLLDELKALKQEHDVARAKLIEVRTLAVAAEEENELLRHQLPAAKEKLQEIRHKHASLEGVVASVEEETEQCGTHAKAMSSTYHLETGLVKPVIALTKGRKQEAEETHSARVVEIASAVEAHKRRPSKDATMDDARPEAAGADRSIEAPTLPQMIFAPVVDFSPRDVMPGLKMAEFNKTSPSSTGIPDPKHVLVRSGQRMMEASVVKSLEACATCGNVFMGDAKFCRSCGSRRDIDNAVEASKLLPMFSQESCLKCGNVFVGDAAFCRKCGTQRLAGPSA